VFIPVIENPTKVEKKINLENLLWGT